MAVVNAAEWQLIEVRDAVHVRNPGRSGSGGSVKSLCNGLKHGEEFTLQV